MIKKSNKKLEKEHKKLLQLINNNCIANEEDKKNIRNSLIKINGFIDILKDNKYFNESQLMEFRDFSKFISKEDMIVLIFNGNFYNTFSIEILKIISKLDDLIDVFNLDITKLGEYGADSIHSLYLIYNYIAIILNAIIFKYELSTKEYKSVDYKEFVIQKYFISKNVLEYLYHTINQLFDIYDTEYFKDTYLSLKNIRKVLIDLEANKYTNKTIQEYNDVLNLIKGDKWATIPTHKIFTALISTDVTSSKPKTKDYTEYYQTTKKNDFIIKTYSEDDNILDTYTTKDFVRNRKNIQLYYLLIDFYCACYDVLEIEKQIKISLKDFHKKIVGKGSLKDSDIKHYKQLFNYLFSTKISVDISYDKINDIEQKTFKENINEVKNMNLFSIKIEVVNNENYIIIEKSDFIDLLVLGKSQVQSYFPRELLKVRSSQKNIFDLGLLIYYYHRINQINITDYRKKQKGKNSKIKLNAKQTYESAFKLTTLLESFTNIYEIHNGIDKSNKKKQEIDRKITTPLKSVFKICFKYGSITKLVIQDEFNKELLSCESVEDLEKLHSVIDKKFRTLKLLITFNYK